MIIIVDGYNKTIAKKDNQIVIKEGKQVIKTILVSKIEQIVIMGKGLITFDAMSLLTQENIECIAIDWRGNLTYCITPFINSKRAELKRKQYQTLKNNKSGVISKEIIKTKIKNQQATLGTLYKSHKNITQLKTQQNKINKILKKIDYIPNKPIDEIRNQILGIEGQASIEYWKGIKEVIPAEFNFKNRTKRPAKDPVNALLNYSYAILQSQILKSINITGLDPYLGFIHVERNNRASLSFDLIEEFRQQIVDKTVIKLINTKQIQIQDFKEDLKDGKIDIPEDIRHTLTKNIMEKLNRKIQYNNTTMTYLEIIELQSNKIAKFIQQNQEYTGFYLRW